ncbi:MAG: hypothetical protein ABSC92_08825 [Rhizomicrobium sp.]|jgi:hypothetical protein
MEEIRAAQGQPGNSSGRPQLAGYMPDIVALADADRLSAPERPHDFSQPKKEQRAGVSAGANAGKTAGLLAGPKSPASPHQVIDYTQFSGERKFFNSNPLPDAAQSSVHS